MQTKTIRQMSEQELIEELEMLKNELIFDEKFVNWMKNKLKSAEELKPLAEYLTKQELEFTLKYS